MSPENRHILREAMRHQRRAISFAAQTLAAEKLFCQWQKLMAEYQDLSHCQHIAAYWPVDGEIDPRKILLDLYSQQKACYLPVINHTKILRFARYYPGLPQANDACMPNRYGIPEPTGETFGAEILDIILMPLVAFDAKGERLGMGGGFYDATLGASKNSYLIGLAHECQRIVPPAEWVARAEDIALDAVITPDRYEVFKPCDITGY